MDITGIDIQHGDHAKCQDQKNKHQGVAGSSFEIFHVEAGSTRLFTHSSFTPFVFYYGKADHFTEVRLKISSICAGRSYPPRCRL